MSKNIIDFKSKSTEIKNNNGIYKLAKVIYNLNLKESIREHNANDWPFDFEAEELTKDQRIKAIETKLTFDRKVHLV